jgi:xanthine dehydrogenase accessory factor
MISIHSRYPIVLLRGGGDLASGVAIRLHRVGIKVVIAELAQPMAVRRTVSFCEAVYRGEITVEGVTARLVDNRQEVLQVLLQNQIPVLIDPNLEILSFIQNEHRLVALVDARMTKRPPDIGMDVAPLVIGLGPGFVAGDNCHAAIETNRGHYLGRVIWHGAPEPDTGIPGAILQERPDRVLRAPCDGVIVPQAKIGDQVKAEQILAIVDEHPIMAPFDGVLRGLLHEGLSVKHGQKIGDLDPRNDPELTRSISEKALAIGGGVLEALLTNPENRALLWN